MIYKTLGKTGWKVSAIGFGAWGIGGQWGGVEYTTATGAVLAAYNAGVNFFDTADAYGDPPGLTEEMIGQALAPVRDRVFIATKAGNFARRQGHALSYTHPLHVELCCDASLRRLRTDYIDVYQCHIAEPKEPEVFLEAFETLQKKGKIRAYGISTDHVASLERFNQGGTCSTNQLDYSLVNRGPEKELLPYCQKSNIGVIVRGPLAQGVLAGKFTAETQFTDSVRSAWNSGAGREKFLRQLATVEKLKPLANASRTLSQIALAFIVAHPAVSTAIPGAKDAAQALANAKAGDLVLSESDWAAIAAASAS